MAFDISDQGRFLAALEQGQTITEACKTVGIPRRSLYAFRKEHPEFDSAIEEAQAASVDSLLSTARERALDRNDPKSATFLIFLIKGALPQYKENYKPIETAKGKDSKTHDFTKEEAEEAKRILDSVMNLQPGTPDTSDD